MESDQTNTTADTICHICGIRLGDEGASTCSAVHGKAAWSKSRTTMVVFYDTDADAARIALLGGIGPGETVRNVQACDGQVVLNFNAAGQLIGIELLNLDMLHLDLAKDAIQMRPIREGDL